jgi:hypothetical protein
MGIDESVPWLTSGVRGPRVILGGMLLCVALGLLSFAPTRNCLTTSVSVLLSSCYLHTLHSSPC